MANEVSDDWHCSCGHTSSSAHEADQHNNEAHG